ncbi:MAG: hypothetical protein L0Y72_02435 [Gemmataceae bacterium]|nr:hypothetical protein [Gemmataceae bacterium]MCI0737874.1 hypothetical protein [Gemmataceae bacterium]
MFVTFYSYKGGVGRSMALANIACLLAQDQEHPQRVLLWDFDLEAPGLHRIFPPKQPHKFGFVDLAHKYARTGKVPEVRDYVYASIIEGIDVLPAGSVDQPYCEKLQELHWPGFFTADPADPGPFFGPFRKAVKQLPYDYVLIDSRTGLNDQAGICTEILPDLIVVLFRLTAQNLDGLEHVVPMIRYQLEARKRNGVRLLPIASVVSPTSSKATLENKEKAARLFEQRKLNYIRFDGDLVTEERLFCQENERQAMWPMPPVVEDYQKLCESLRTYNKEDTRTQTSRIRQATEEGDFVLATTLLTATIERRVRNSELWRILERLFDTGIIKKEDTADLVERVLQKDPQNRYCYEWKGTRLIEEAKSPTSSELATAKRDIERAISLSTRPSMRLLRILARIQSCQGDLENAVKTLRDAQEKQKGNVQINFELALLHMRMGANYFSSAIDALQQIRRDIDEKFLWNAYLYAFLGEHSKADEAFTRHMQRERGKWAQLCRAHFLLLGGKRDEAIQVARSCAHASVDESELTNWAEFLICAEAFDDAKILLTTWPKDESKKEGDAVMLLCQYLDGTNPIDEHEVIKAWQGHTGWGFKELILFRESVKRRGESALRDRLSIVEKLIQYQDLASFRGGRRLIVSGTSGVGTIRMFATRLSQSFETLFS